MNKTAAKQFISSLLSSAGIQINGRRPSDIQIHNEKFYQRLIHEGSLGLGESYMDGWWDCEQLDEFFNRVFCTQLDDKITQNKWMLASIFFSRFIHRITKKRSLEVGRKHYDLGNDLFKKMLDKRLNYTCGYWRDANNLDQAQLHKLELTCQKLMLKPGMRLLDIGCGWGALAKYAAENYNVSVVGVTISQEQADYARENCKHLPVEIRFQDYRDVNEKFDRIASLGMFEHVGFTNYDTFMHVVERCLNEYGVFLLHTIGSNQTIFKTDEWISKYIFTHGVLPSISQIGKTSEKLFIMEDWHNFGADYDKTLMAWHANFNHHWSELKNRYDERFYRMWNYYLLSCAGGFRAREMQLWQIVFSKSGLTGGYQAPREAFQDRQASQDSSKNLYSAPPLLHFAE